METILLLATKGMVDLEVREIDVPIWEKLNLTIEEASKYSNIGVSTLRDIVNKNDTFVLHVGNKKLIKRKEFEQWIAEKFIIK